MGHLLACAGDYVVRAGEIGDKMFFIRSGRCRVLIPDSNPTTTRRAGSTAVDIQTSTGQVRGNDAWGKLSSLFGSEKAIPSFLVAVVSVLQLQGGYCTPHSLPTAPLLCYPSETEIDQGDG
jgi:hypothetical protein